MRKPHFFSLAFFAFVPFFGGCIGGGYIAATQAPRDKGPTTYALLPHHVPPSPESPAFRFAMVHDVIHERYARHGDAFYEERERLARERLTGFHPDSETAFALTDDIAVGLDRRGKSEEATALMRDKLKRQEALGLKGRELYSSYANLAEFLLRGHLWGMMKGEAEHRTRVQESVDLIRKSMEVNPKAHFGREEWQLVAVDSLLALGASPELARKSDLVGNRLDVSITITDESLDWRFVDPESDFISGRPYSWKWAQEFHGEGRGKEFATRDHNDLKRKDVRDLINEVGGEVAGKETQHRKRGKRAPFDEPALWLVGEWRQGSGPNPHSALCLGEIMLRVGQRYLAWSCYERASRMADAFWPTVQLQQFLRSHSQERQASIEKSLPPQEVAGLRVKFDAELAFGQKYQQDYQVYAQEQIQAGKDLNGAHFFDEFYAGRAPIASKVGPEEWYAGQKTSYGMRNQIRAFWMWGLLTGGALMLVCSLGATMSYRPKPNPLSVREISLPETHQPPQSLNPLRPDAADPS